MFLHVNLLCAVHQRHSWRSYESAAHLSSPIPLKQIAAAFGLYHEMGAATVLWLFPGLFYRPILLLFISSLLLLLKTLLLHGFS